MLQSVVSPQTARRFRSLTTSIGLGAACIGFGTGCFNKQREPDKSPTSIIDASFLSNSKLIASLDEAMELVGKGAVAFPIYEMEGQAPDVFSYFFNLRQPADDHSSCLLRVQLDPADRNDFFDAIDKAGGEIRPGFLSYKPKIDMPSISPLYYLASGILGLYIASRLYRWHREKRDERINKQDMLSDKPEDRFHDIGGCPHIVQDYRDLAEDIAKVQKGERISLPAGLLALGPPGVGKTLSARALAGETDCPFIYVNSSWITSSRYMGDWSDRLLSTFTDGRQVRAQETKRLQKLYGPNAQGVVIIFFDEFNSIGAARQAEEGGSGHERNNLVNALLAEMDNIDGKRNRNLVILGACNEIVELDPALLRPGRFSKQLHYTEPRTFSQRLDILKRLENKILKTAGFQIERPQILENLASITAGDSGDNLRGILMEASHLARRECRTTLTEADLIEAYQRLKFGRIEDDIFSEEKRALIACHEIGHAIMMLATRVKPFVASMFARGNTGGRVIADPELAFVPPHTRAAMQKMVLLKIGGRAAEIFRMD